MISSELSNSDRGVTSAPTEEATRSSIAGVARNPTSVLTMTISSRSDGNSSDTGDPPVGILSPPLGGDFVFFAMIIPPNMFLFFNILRLRAIHLVA